MTGGTRRASRLRRGTGFRSVVAPDILPVAADGRPGALAAYPGTVTAALTPDLVREWATGWARARRIDPPVAVEGGLRVRLGLPEREFEYIALDPSPESLGRLAAQARGDSASDDWVTVVTTEPDAVASALRESGLRIEDRREWFMTIDLAAHPVRPLPEGYRIESAVHAEVLFAMIWHGDERAGSGRIAFADVAVADKIETSPTRRRLGLGAALMSELTGRAREAGGRTGALVASSDGERLYSSLGWRALGRVVIARTTPPH